MRQASHRGWRRVLLPARCFTSTVSFGWHHLTSCIREFLNAAHDVARRSSSPRNRARSSPASDECRLQHISDRHYPCERAAP